MNYTLLLFKDVLHACGPMNYIISLDVGDLFHVMKEYLSMKCVFP